MKKGGGCLPPGPQSDFRAPHLSTSQHGRHDSCTAVLPETSGLRMTWAHKSGQEKRMGTIQPGKCVAGAQGARGGTLLSFVGQEITSLKP